MLTVGLLSRLNVSWGHTFCYVLVTAHAFVLYISIVLWDVLKLSFVSLYAVSNSGLCRYLICMISCIQSCQLNIHGFFNWKILSVKDWSVFSLSIILASKPKHLKLIIKYYFWSVAFFQESSEIINFWFILRGVNVKYDSADIEEIHSSIAPGSIVLQKYGECDLLFKNTYNRLLPCLL